MKRRKIEKMFIVESLNYVHTYIECNDGTIFQKMKNTEDGEDIWVEEPAIPQPKKEELH